MAGSGCSPSIKRDNGRAVADFDKSLSFEEPVETYYMRAKVCEAKGQDERAVVDFRRAIELPPKGLFEVMAQADAKKRIERSGKRTPCGTAGRS